MKRSNKILLTTLLATGIVATAAVTAAPGGGPGGCPQGGGPMMQGDGYGPGGGGGKHGRWQKSQRDPAAIENRIDAVHDKLGITEEQEPAWQAFTDKVRTQVETMRDHRETMRTRWSQSDGLTAPERIRARTEMMNERLAAMTEMGEAVETFYAELTPEQQEQFDRMPMMLGRHQKRGF